jgi:uncharacterized protein
LADVLIADSSGIIAAIDAGEPDHSAVRKLLARDERPLVTIDLVVAEVDYMVLTRLGADAERSFLRQLIEGVFLREPLRDADIERALEISERLSDHEIGLTDAALMAVSERLGARDVLTLDHRHFRLFRDRRGRALRLLPE